MSNCLEILNEQEAKAFLKNLTIDETMAMIDVIMDAQKNYKLVPSIVPLFQVTILKLVAKRKGGEAKQVEAPFEDDEPTPIFAPLPETSKPQPKIAESTEEKTEPPVEKETISLFEQPEIEESQIVLSKNVISLKGTIKGDSFYIDDELMINVMVTSKKEIKNQLIENWSNIKKLIAHPTLGKAATTLIDGRPLVASTKVLVIEYQFQNIAEKANLVVNQEDIQT